ncbi:MAG: alpha/beta hydrolase [Leptolyngbyaceae bacterium]|nr:alpha/beta hydrolase [Leptolyngbyaceae bacterium]
MTLHAIAIPNQEPGAPPVGLYIALHGWGANCKDLFGLSPYLKRPDFYMAFPDAPYPHPYNPEGRMWYDLSTEFTTTGSNFSFGTNFENELAASREQLINWIQDISFKTNIPLNRTILSGFSQGAAMTLDLGCRMPFAALMILSGYAHTPLPSDPSHLPISLPPMLMAHGRHDPVVPIELARDAHQALLKLNAPVQYHELEMGHEISLDLLNLMQIFVGEVAKNLR